MSERVPGVGWVVAFGAGVAWFSSPGSAPLVPGDFWLVSGSAGGAAAADGGRAPTLLALRTSLLFLTNTFFWASIAVQRLSYTVDGRRRRTALHEVVPGRRRWGASTTTGGRSPDCAADLVFYP